jgi:acyl carrier protein
MSITQKLDKGQIADRLARVASEILKVPVDASELKADLAQDYGADSMDFVDITNRVEREFNTTIDTEDVLAFKTFGQFVDYIARRIAF